MARPVSVHVAPPPSLSSNARRPVIPGPHSTGRPEVIEGSGVALGQPFIDFTLPRVEGGELTLSDYAGKPIFLEFWATWCSPCRVEAPALALIYEIFGEHVQILREVFRALDGDSKRGNVPELWDGRTAGRVADVLEYDFLEREAEVTV